MAHFFGRAAGAIIATNAGASSIVGILVCWFALFAPGILMIFAVLPWWGAFRSFKAYRRCAYFMRIFLNHTRV